MKYGWQKEFTNELTLFIKTLKKMRVRAIPVTKARAFPVEQRAIANTQRGRQRFGLPGVNRWRTGAQVTLGGWDGKQVSQASQVFAVLTFSTK